MIRKLTPGELDAILASLDRERHFLYFSYLTSRKQNTVHYGQFTEQGELLGVLAFLTGLPFHAFSVFPAQKSFDFRAVLAFMKEQLDLPVEAIGNFIVHEQDMADLRDQIAFSTPPEKLLLMKHIHHQMLPSADPRVLRLGPADFGQIESMMKKLGTMAFTKEELDHPFFGVAGKEGLIAVGGYHIYSEDYVELGNIGTDAAFRRQGLGKMVCAELTRAGAAVSPNVYLNVFEENEAAIRLYQSIGYENVAHQYIIQFVIPA
ncbi:GNAT family N-acetyltransferase [Paenibacillus azoreducens]|uniref:N-acetyltransferase domain-containing protein n=1 Tax=Paenibacillus azoreducens TaxID=116718 RepID=A0A919YF11_9BACL|nr:GNAT family N-acetyltransferase [Paenibacillus azoreducens]GIO48458.1 hypothetical protein J34TS1_32230 [Paenibacillus azoreducens]